MEANSDKIIKGSQLNSLSVYDMETQAMMCKAPQKNLSFIPEEFLRSPYKHKESDTFVSTWTETPHRAPKVIGGNLEW